MYGTPYLGSFRQMNQCLKHPILKQDINKQFQNSLEKSSLMCYLHPTIFLRIHYFDLQFFEQCRPFHSLNFAIL